MLTESCVMFFRRPVLFKAVFCEMNIWPRRLELKKETPSLVLTAEVKYSSCKTALKTARDGEKNMTHDSVNVFLKGL